MQNIIEILKKYGVEIPADKLEDFNKDVAANYKTEAEFEKKLGKLESERDNWKQKAEDAENTLNGFEGVDVQQIKTDLESWKRKAEDTEKEYNEKIHKRDFSDALKAELGAYKFTSEAAKRSIMQEIESADLKLSDGKILGLNDFIGQIKERDASAFVNEDDEDRENSKARFTKQMNGAPEGKKMSKEDIFKIKDATERQQAIRDNIELFQN